MPVEGVRRPAWAEISRGALRHNVGVLREVLGDSQICGVVKANAYGHGAVLAASTFVDAGVAGLAVAIVDEGVELREAGITAPILLLAETPADTVGDAFDAGLTLTIASVEGARAAVAAASERGGRHRVHVKLDTGMHRMGADEKSALEILDVLLTTPTIVIEGLYTHFTSADSPAADDAAFTEGQIERFTHVVDAAAQRGVHPALLHVANSAGSLAFPRSRFAMARVGLSLYGHLPHPDLATRLSDRNLSLRPALSLKARVTAVRHLAAGERPSYGRRRALTTASTVATVPFGYADGYPRRLFEAGAEVLIRGRRYPLAGSVTMDQLVIDCGTDEISIGDEVVLLGAQGSEVITAEKWATWADTITWEILCGIGARVPRAVVD